MLKAKFHFYKNPKTPCVIHKNEQERTKRTKLTQSYSSGISHTPLIGETIDDYFDQLEMCSSISDDRHR